MQVDEVRGLEELSLFENIFIALCGIPRLLDAGAVVVIDFEDQSST